MRIKIVVNGIPVPQGSGFAVSKHGQVFNPRANAAKPWREAIRAETQRAMNTAGREPLPGPLHVLIGFQFRRPKSHYRTGRNAHLLKDQAPAYPDGKPDLDKLCRAVLDGLTEGRAFWDDAQVVQLAASKVYGEPGAEITIGEVIE